MEEALRLYDQAPPSVDHATAWFEYADIVMYAAEGGGQASVPVLLNRALEIAEAAGATGLIPRILAFLAEDAWMRGQVEEGFMFLDRGWALARAADDGQSLARLGVNQSDGLLKLAKFQSAAEVGSRALEDARQAGLLSWFTATLSAFNAAEALLALGRTTGAAALIDPLTAGSPNRDFWLVHVARAEIDMLRGETDAAADRWQQIYAFPRHLSRVDFSYEAAPRAVEAALWAGRPGDALRETQRALALFRTPDLTIFSGRLLTAGMRACADLAEQARARRDQPGYADAVAAADALATWVEQMGGAPFAGHPWVAAIPAERATWDAERTRLTGASDPAAWSAAAGAWQDLRCPHRAGYAWWRQAQAELDAGHPVATAAATLRAAAAAADGHAPLRAQVRLLAERARIPLQSPAAASEAPPSVPARALYGLTGRELAVLRLLAAGRTNAQIAAELYISPSTASVHVSSILRKLGVSSRVQAATIAERAGLLHQGQP
jgi:DNA-binding CsgD family transcriptional regulator